MRVDGPACRPVDSVMAMTRRDQMVRYRLAIFSMFLTASTSAFAGETLEA
jgi:hypothetical protein